MDDRTDDQLDAKPLEHRAERFPPGAGRRRFPVSHPMIRALVLALGLLAAIHPAAAEDGRALVVAGQVMLERTAPGAVSTTALAAGAEIRSGDTIRTGGDGRVQIRFSDGSIVALQPDTAFRVDDYRYERNERRAFFFLLRGALRTMTGAIGKTNHDAEYRLKTPTATVGVRGTEYVAEQTVCDPRCSPGSRPGLRVAVSQGRIALLTAAGGIEVGTGESAAAESADAPPQPTERGPVLPPISSTKSREHLARGTTGDATGRTAGSAGPGTTARAGSGSAPTFDPATGATSPAPKAVPHAPGTSLTDAESTAATGSGSQPSSTGAWPRFVTTEAGLPAARVSPNERRGPGAALLPVVDLLAPSVPPGASEGGGSDNTGGGSGNPAGGDGNVLPDPDPPTTPPPTTSPETTPPTTTPPPTLGAGMHPIDPGTAPGSGPSLRVLHPWPFLDAGQGRVREGSIELDTEMRLNAFQMPIETLGALCDIGWLCRVSKSRATIEEAGHDDWTSWGRWTGENAQLMGFWPLPLADNRSLHYLVGVPSATIPTSGVFGYELIGSTRATLSGSNSTGLFDGRVAVAFSPSGARVGIDANVAFPSGAYRFATSGGVADPTRSPLATLDAGHSFRGEIAATGSHAPLDCTAGCPVQVDGGLFGPDAARVGITYRISGSGGGSTISGVGVFGKKSP
ncbi:MAG: FecR family protein [Burkholderiaceae bacterium]|nr:FecR family protein [Burkholderiaceae bacterium]